VTGCERHRVRRAGGVHGNTGLAGDINGHVCVRGVADNGHCRHHESRKDRFHLHVGADQSSAWLVPAGRLRHVRHTAQSFDDVVYAHRPAVTAFTRSLVRDSALVDDIVQETFIRVWRYMPTFRGEGSFEGWIIRICHNVIRTTMKKHKVTEPMVDDLENAADDYGTFDLLDLILTLGPEHRAVTVLCLVLGHTYEDAADILGIPVGTVRSRVSRARSVLQEKLTATAAVRTTAG